MQSAPPNFSFRLGVALWGTRHQIGWPRGHVLITPESISMRMPGCQHVHRKVDLVELRWNDWWLNARLTVISRQENEVSLSITETRRWQPLLAALQTCDYTFTGVTHREG